MSNDGNTAIPGNMCSEKFNAIDADVVFKSCDDVLFNIHRRNLEICTGGFPPSGFETCGEIIPLPESSSTLELLFQYIYPNPQPDIRSSSFETILAVAEAAGKYQVYPAIYVCTIILEMALPDNAHEIFVHAGRHGHTVLLGKTAPYVVGTPLREIVIELPGYLIGPWISYHAAWESQIQEARMYPFKTMKDERGLCNISSSYHLRIIDYMAKLEDVKALKDLTAVFGESNNRDGGDLATYLRKWRAAIESNIKKMKSFDTYVVVP